MLSSVADGSPYFTNSMSTNHLLKQWTVLRDIGVVYLQEHNVDVRALVSFILTTFIPPDKE